jgi:hypothetical protein
MEVIPFIIIIIAMITIGMILTGSQKGINVKKKVKSKSDNTDASSPLFFSSTHDSASCDSSSSSGGDCGGGGGGGD